MTVLRFRQGGNDVGAISWFATHNTSITNANTLISPDNKGYAAYQWEHDDEGVRYLDNTAGVRGGVPEHQRRRHVAEPQPEARFRPHRERVGERPRHRRAPEPQGAGDLQRPAGLVAGGVDSRMRFVDMSAVQVEGRYTPNGQAGTTCSGVVGASTIAGSVEDGPAIPGFSEGMQSPWKKLLRAVADGGPAVAAGLPVPQGLFGANGSDRRDAERGAAADRPDRTVAPRRGARRGHDHRGSAHPQGRRRRAGRAGARTC